MRSIQCLLGITVLFASLPSWAAVSEMVTRENFRASLCNISEMSVRARLDEAFGEPLLTSSVRWDAGPNTASDCLSGLTSVWLQVRLQDDSLRYIKLTPLIGRAGSDFGETATESPMWALLFCERPEDGSFCEPPDAARRIFGESLQIEGFEVTADVGALATIAPTPSSDSSRPASGDLSLDSLLAEAIDQAASGGEASSEPEPEAPQALTPEQIADLEQEQQDERARMAVNNVVTLIAASLAEYQAPSHECEQNRVVANWVQSRGTCQLNFRSESSHEFVCGGDARPVKATRRANLDLTQDVRSISQVRVSGEGWASVVLELSDKLHTTSDGEFNTDRWRFTTDANRAEDLRQLASSILTLKDYCEGPDPF